MHYLSGYVLLNMSIMYCSKLLTIICFFNSTTDSKGPQNFLMVLWLVTYFEFFEKKVSLCLQLLYCNNSFLLQQHSEVLGRFIGHPKMLEYLHNDCYINFIRSFIQPTFMLRSLEINPNPIYDLFHINNFEDQSK